MSIINCSYLKINCSFESFFKQLDDKHILKRKSKYIISLDSKVALKLESS